MVVDVNVVAEGPKAEIKKRQYCFVFSMIAHPQPVIEVAEYRSGRARGMDMVSMGHDALV